MSRRRTYTAQIFHERIVEHLDLHRDNKAKVAKFLGVSRQSWDQYLRGKRNPSEKTLNTWLRLCRDDGMTGIPDTVQGALLATMTE